MNRYVHRCCNERLQLRENDNEILLMSLIMLCVEIFILCMGVWMIWWFISHVRQRTCENTTLAKLIKGQEVLRCHVFDESQYRRTHELGGCWGLKCLRLYLLILETSALMLTSALNSKVIKLFYE